MKIATRLWISTITASCCSRKMTIENEKPDFECEKLAIRGLQYDVDNSQHFATHF